MRPALLHAPAPAAAAVSQTTQSNLLNVRFSVHHQTILPTLVVQVEQSDRYVCVFLSVRTAFEPNDLHLDIRHAG